MTAFVPTYALWHTSIKLFFVCFLMVQTFFHIPHALWYLILLFYEFCQLKRRARCLCILQYHRPANHVCIINNGGPFTFVYRKAQRQLSYGYEYNTDTGTLIFGKQEYHTWAWQLINIYIYVHFYLGVQLMWCVWIQRLLNPATTFFSFFFSFFFRFHTFKER